MASIHDPIHDIGTEFAHRFDRDVCRFARAFDRIAREAPNARTAGERAQAEADRLLMLADEDATRARDQRISDALAVIAAGLLFPALGFLTACNI